MNMKVSEIITCPFCGQTFEYEFDVKVRNPIGKGTRRPIKKLTRNHIQLIDTIMRFAQFKTVREIRNELMKRGLKYQSRKGKRYWDYHTVEAVLSVLVYNGFVSMTKPNIEYYDFESGEFRAEPVPRYYV